MHNIVVYVFLILPSLVSIIIWDAVTSCFLTEKVFSLILVFFC